MTQHKEKAADLLEQIDGNDSKPNSQVKEEPMKTVTNLPVSTDNRTPVEVIPVLTADNFATIAERFHDYPVPANILEDNINASVGGRGVYLNSYDKITTATGQPTDWFVHEEEQVMNLTTPLPCSVANCEGHTLLEGERWDDLFHEIYKAPLPNTDFGIQHTSGGTIYLQKKDENYLASFYFTGEGDLPLNDLDDLIEHLQQTITAVQKFKETATVIAQVTNTLEEL